MRIELEVEDLWEVFKKKYPSYGATKGKSPKQIAIKFGEWIVEEYCIV